MKKAICVLLTLTMVMSSAVFTFAAETKATTDTSTWETSGSDYSSGFKEYFHNPMFDDVVRYDGVDVSIFNGNIDWKKVKADGIDFAIIRIGGRFYGGGGLYPDDLFEQNYKGAKAAGVKIGLYFYSQAKTEAEAEEEVEYIMDMLDGRNIDLPIYMDYECPSGSRISKMTKTQGTKNVKAFCEAVEAEGYDAGFYSYPAFINKYVDAEEISSLYPVWVAHYYHTCSYEYDYDMWQYSSGGHVEGISDRVDVNFWYDKTTLRKDLSKITTTIEYIKTQYDGKAKKPKITVNGLTEGKDYYLSYSDNTEVGTATVTIKGKKEYRGTITKTFEILREMSGTDKVFATSDELRVYGNNRFETAEKIADTIKTYKGTDKFDNIIVASANDYADALAASSLAKKKNAPILLVNSAAVNETSVKDYIKGSLKSGGTVYIAGGEGAVSAAFENSLKSSGYSVKRLAGANRYETNLAILGECGSISGGLIVSSGLGYADSLSASATGLPILLVGSTLSDAQLELIANSSGTVYIAGGTGAVSEEIETQIREIKSSVQRFNGTNRYQTSYLIANAFFSSAREAAIVASGDNFPDGLVSGPLGQSMNAPVLLVNGNNTNYAKQYASNKSVSSIAGVAGPALLSDVAFNSII